jgi:hypothetical protein
MSSTCPAPTRALTDRPLATPTGLVRGMPAPGARPPGTRAILRAGSMPHLARSLAPERQP